MWTLGFDSTASNVTAALLRDGDLVSFYTADSATSHSTTLLPAIEALLRAAGITAKDLSLISCSAGPGSFTGVRIGVSTAKGLAAPFDTPCIGVSSLEAMAYSFADVRCIVCPSLGARRGNVYAALFYSDGEGCITRLCDDDLISIAEMGAFVKSSIDEGSVLPLYVCGDSIKEVSASIEEADGIMLRKTPAMMAPPSGFGAALCGYAKYIRDDTDKSSLTGARLVPIYLRKSQAEREKEERERT